MSIGDFRVTTRNIKDEIGQLSAKIDSMQHDFKQLVLVLVSAIQELIILA